MASINVRIDDELKARAYRELEKLGVTPSELMRQALQYVADVGSFRSRPCWLRRRTRHCLQGSGSDWPILSE